MTEKKNDVIEALNEKASAAEIRKQMEGNPTDSNLWYRLGLALSDEEGPDAGIDAFSQGISYNPFNASLYFGRGRKNIGLGHYWRCIADTTMAIRLDPGNWSHWYYRAVAYNINGNHREAEADFLQCYRMVDSQDYYPVVDWLYVNYVEMGDMKKAREILTTVPNDLEHPSKHGAYKKRVVLYKGESDPESFINMDEVIAAAKQNGDPDERLELSTLLFGLYVYHMSRGDDKKTDETLLRLLEDPFPNAFGSIKGAAAAKKRGLKK